MAEESVKRGRSVGAYDSVDATLDTSRKRCRGPAQGCADDQGQVEVFYFSRSVAGHQFKTQCHLVNSKHNQEGPGFVKLPPASQFKDQVADQKDIGKAFKILESLEGGLKLEYEDGNIYATRYCKTHIFYSGYDIANTSVKLEREVRTLIFDYEAFCRADADWRRRHGKAPCNRVFLGFAKQCFHTDGLQNLPLMAEVKCRKVQPMLDQSREDLESAMASLCISKEKEVPETGDVIDSFSSIKICENN